MTLLKFKQFFLAALSLMSLLTVQPIFADDTKQQNIEIFRHNSLIGWNVNSYWIETGEGIIFIDGQLLVRDAENLANLVKSRNKKIAGLILTHPHPDHFGGIATLQKVLGKFPVYATKATHDALIEANKTYMNNAAKTFGDGIHKKLIMPDKLIASGTSLNLAGTELVIDDLGPGESADNVVVWHPQTKTLFTGDATMHGSHFYTGEGRSAAILNSFEYLKKTYKDASQLLTGHGDPASLTIVDTHIDYVKSIRKLTFAAMQKQTNLTKEKNALTNEARKKVAMLLVKKYPSLGSYGMPAEQIAAWNIFGVESEFK